jgi:membrane protease YdiL (CAAX protease family)
MLTLWLVLSFPLLITLGYAGLLTLAKGNQRILTGPWALLSFLGMLLVPLSVVWLNESQHLRFGFDPGWVLVGLFSGLALWLVASSLQGQVKSGSSVWCGRPGWLGYLEILLINLLIVLAEEILWRGYLLRHLGILGAALWFSAHHYFFGWRAIVLAFAAAVLWGSFAWWSDELTAGAISHFVYNALVWRSLREHCLPRQPTS